MEAADVRALGHGIRSFIANGERPQNRLQRAAEIAGIPLKRAHSIARNQTELLSSIAGVAVTYQPAAETTSGRGSFGRLGGSGRRYRYHKADISIGEAAR